MNADEPPRDRVTPTPAAEAGTARLRRGIVAGGVAVILAFAATSGYDAWRSYGHAVRATERELRNLARALAAESEHSLETVDLLLRNTAGWYADGGRRLPAEAVSSSLDDRVLGLTQVRDVGIVDAQGLRRHRSHSGTAAAPLDVSARPYFTAQRDRPDTGLFISEPLELRSTHRAGLVLSRRISEADGRFGGIVIAIIDLEGLQRVYAAIDLGAGNSIRLLRDDGSPVLRYPPGADDAAAGADGHFEAAARAGAFGLRVVVARERRVALQTWQGEAIWLLVGTLCFAAFGGAAMGLALRRLTRNEQARRERERLEAQLRQSQKLEALGTLAGGMAHDFNNILGAVLGYGELAQRRLAPGDPARPCVDHMVQAGQRARSLVDSILGFSRGGVGERMPVNLQAVVDETLGLLAASLPENVRLERALSTGDAAVRGDATQLVQVAMNLCTNAVHAMPAGGVLTVTLSAVALDEPKRLPHGSLRAGRHLRLVVGDTGTGIASAVMERLFEPFFTTKPVGSGTGLGLSLVHGIVADHGGAIEVESRAGHGSRFTVWLPQAGSAPAPAAAPEGELPQGRGEVVMVVDDEPQLVALAEEMLAELGYEPAGFVSSASALQAFRADPQRFDLLLSDQAMPGTAGVDLAAALRRLRPELPVVLMSGRAGPQLAERARAAGVRELLRKPLQRRDIAECLARSLAPAH